MIVPAKYEAIAALKDRRREILREITQLGTNVEARQQDLVHIEACLKIFGATDDQT